MEQSKVEPAVVSESFVSDKEWFKATFSFDLILTALRENNVEGYVREILRPKYGVSPMFHFIVADVLHEVLQGLVSKLQEYVKWSAFCVMIDGSHIQKAEKALESRLVNARSMGYWRGESV